MKKMIVLSIDSMIGSDRTILEKLPHFSRVLSESSFVEHMLSTYPTLTHSVHTSIQTGCNPGRHGVINNEIVNPGIPKAPWFEESSLVKVKTLPQEAAKHGYKTAYVFWPVTLHADVPWVLHRAFIHTKAEKEWEVVRERSTPGLFDEVAPIAQECSLLPHYESGDAFCGMSTEYLIRTYQPDIVYIHMILIDHLRHCYGVYSEKIEEGYRFLDVQLGRILDALDATDLYDKTIFCLTSDHGQLDVNRSISLNLFFQNHGLCTISSKGDCLSDWKVYAHSAALSSQIYVKDHDPEICAQVRSLLEENKDLLGISEVFTVDETRERYQSWGDYDLVVETDGKTSFGFDLTCPLEVKTDNSDYRTSVASHGHLPEKEPQPCFYVRNPYNPKASYVERGRIIDQAPTLARMLGFSMTDCDGVPMEALL